MRGPGANRAVVGLLLVMAGIGCYKLVERLRPPEGDLVITGRTPAAPRTLKADSIPAETPAPRVASLGKPAPASLVPITSSPTQVVVHVAGDVRKPGVYRLAPDARADDALKAAGGAKPDANLDAINLAARVEDGKQLYVPTKKERPEGGAPEQTASAQPSPSPAPAGRHAAPAAGGHASKLTSPSQGTVNINTASAEDLEKLPGVGPSFAQRILQFRKDNGPFTSPDQLMDVSGIGAKKYEKMRPFVRIK